MTTDDNIDPEALVSVLVETDGNGQITHLEIIDGRFSDDFELSDVASPDPAKCRTQRVFAGNRNGGDSLEETDRYDHGTWFDR